MRLGTVSPVSVTTNPFPMSILWVAIAFVVFFGCDDRGSKVLDGLLQEMPAPVRSYTGEIEKVDGNADPNVRYRYTGGQINAVNGFAHDGTQFYIVDENTDALYTLDSTRRIASRVGNAKWFGQAKLYEPRGLAWDGENLFMAGDNSDWAGYDRTLWILDRTNGTAMPAASKHRRQTFTNFFPPRNTLRYGEEYLGVVDPRGIAWDGEIMWLLGSRSGLVGDLVLAKLDRVNAIVYEHVTPKDTLYLGLETNEHGSGFLKPNGLTWDGENLYTTWSYFLRDTFINPPSVEEQFTKLVKIDRETGLASVVGNFRLPRRTRYVRKSPGGGEVQNNFVLRASGIGWDGSNLYVFFFYNHLYRVISP